MMRTGGASVNLLAHFHYSNDRNNDFSGDQDEKTSFSVNKTHMNIPGFPDLIPGKYQYSREFPDPGISRVKPYSEP